MLKVTVPQLVTVALIFPLTVVTGLLRSFTWSPTQPGLFFKQGCNDALAPSVFDGVPLALRWTDVCRTIQHVFSLHHERICISHDYPSKHTNVLSSPVRHQQLFPSCSSQRCTGLEVFTFATATARGCIVGATCSPHWVINEPHIQAQDPKQSEGREEKKIPQLLPWKRVNSGLFPKSREIKLPFGLKAHRCSLQHIRPESLLAKRRISKSKGP